MVKLMQFGPNQNLEFIVQMIIISTYHKVYSIIIHKLMFYTMMHITWPLENSFGVADITQILIIQESTIKLHLL